MDRLPKPYRRFHNEQPEVWQAFENLGAVIAQAGPLEPKVRELVKLGMAAACGSESAVQSHTHRALQAGVTQEEIEHAILLGITTIGFPQSMAALSWAKSAFDTHGSEPG